MPERPLLNGHSEQNPQSTITGPATVLAAEGARVGIVSCELCGAAILLDSRETFDPIARHIEWHKSIREPHIGPLPKIPDPPAPS